MLSEQGVIAWLERVAEPLRREHAVPSAALQAVMGVLAGAEGVSRVLAALWLAEQRQLLVEHVVGLAEPAAPLQAVEGPLGRAAAFAQPIAQAGTWADVEERPGSASRTVCVPIVARGVGVVGVLAWERLRRPDDAPHVDIELLSVVAGLVAGTVARLRTEREAQHERERERVRDGGMLAQLRTHGFLARTEPARQVLSQVREAAASPVGATVLISGESGVGKSLLAHTLHMLGPHPNGPMLTIACDALGVREAQLGPAGWLEQARGGTLLLEHVDRMSSRVQVSLLRALQSPGALHQLRLVSTTRTELATEVRATRFRGDLYYRLQSFGIEIPPLRERSGDIVPLAEHFLLMLSDAHRGPAPELPPAAARKLVAHDWPGNVRELHNAVERALLVTRGRLVEPGSFVLRREDGSPEAASGAEAGTLQEQLRRFERKLLFDALQQARGRKAAAARALGMTPRAFAYRLSR